MEFVSSAKTIIEVPNFLEVSFAESVTHYAMSTMPKEWFSRSIFPTHGEYRMSSYPDTLELAQNPEFQAVLRNSNEQFEKGNFAYSFRRTFDNHYSTCRCSACVLGEHFRSSTVMEQLSSIVQQKVVAIEETFLSKYERDDFLSTHHDRTKGDYAFSLQLTKHWNPVHGGLLTFVEDNRVTKTISPEFNSLTIFRIRDVQVTDHFVSKVVADKTRLAFTGWFSVEEKETKDEE